MAEDVKVEVQPENEVQEEQVVLTAQSVNAEQVVVEEPTAQEQSEVSVTTGKESSKFVASLKEWGRKKVVGLKRKPQSIVLVCLFITTAIWLIWLFTFSRTIARNSVAEWCGLVVFINTLISILVLALFGSAFPKRKKPSIVFIVLLFVFMAVIIACDVIYYVQMNSYVYGKSGLTASDLAKAPYIEQSLSYSIAHIVLVGICVVLLATLPLYTKLINMINTKKEVVGNEIKEVIDVEED